MNESKRKARTRGNGQGTAFKRGNTWTAQVTKELIKDDNGKIIKRTYATKGGFKLKREALAYCDELLHGTPINKLVTFAGLYDLWSKEHYPKVSKDGENGYRAAYAKCTALYTRQFSTLKAADLQATIDNAKSLKGEELSRRAKADIKSLFNNMYGYAIKNDYCDKNYAELIELEKKPKSKKEAFSQVEINKLWEDYNAGNIFTGYILVMIYTGMRFGEISTVLKENIHLSERYMIGGIKTDAGIDREIPIAEKIYPIIEKLFYANKKKLLEMHEKVFYNSFYATLKRLQIRKLSPHACRHTFFTLMAIAKVAPAVITETGGHEDYQTTMRYTHIPLSEKISAVNLL